MNNINVEIWGRNFDLYVSYQNFPDETVTPNQTTTLEAITSVDFTESLINVKQYVLKHNAYDVKGNYIDNIFKYVMPKSILITRNENAREFAIMCNYKFDMEHGLAVVFENEKYKEVGSEDIIL